MPIFMNCKIILLNKKAKVFNYIIDWIFLDIKHVAKKSNSCGNWYTCGTGCGYCATCYCSQHGPYTCISGCYFCQMLPPCTCWIHGIDYDCSSSCPDCYGNGDGGDDGNGDGDGGGNDDGNGDGGGEIPDENDCPTYVALTMQDANNPFRYAAPGQPLVMVGGTREANLKLVNLSGSVQGYPIWSGTGISGSGIFGQYVGSTNSTVYALMQKGCNPVTGQINIVPDNEISLSYKISEIEYKINDVGSAVKNGLSALGQTTTSGPVWEASLTGEIYQKNVDKYLDGSAYDYYYGLNINGSITGKMPTLKIWVCNYGVAQIYGFLDLGNISTGLTLEGVKDPSKANQYSLDGNLCLSFNSAELGVTGMFGVENILCSEITVQATLAKFEVCNGFTINSSGIYTDPKIEYSDVVAEIKVLGKFLNNIECSLFNWNAPIITTGSIPLERKLIYSF